MTDPSQQLLSVEEVGLGFGGVRALDGVTFAVEAGTICGLIGPNGAGKTSLFNCISRLYTPSSGTLRFDGKDMGNLRPHDIARVGIARTFQNLGLYAELSILENVMLGAQHRVRSGLVASALGLPGARRERAEIREHSQAIIARLDLEDVADHRATGLPYPTLKRVELARAIVSEPRLLLLDEPAGGLSHGEVDELGDLIRRLRDELGLTILLVEHHMGLVMGISDHVVVLDFGRKLAEGEPSVVQNNPAVIEAYLGTVA